MKVQEILMTKHGGVITILPEKTIREAVHLLANERIGAVVVANSAGTPVGILSERDIVRESAKHGEAVFNLTVGDIMTRNLIVATPEDEIAYLTHTMTEKRIRHLPVIEDGKMIGIVTIGDVVKAQMIKYEGDIHTLQQHLQE